MFLVQIWMIVVGFQVMLFRLLFSRRIKQENEQGTITGGRRGEDLQFFPLI